MDEFRTSDLPCNSNKNEHKAIFDNSNTNVIYAIEKDRRKKVPNMSLSSIENEQDKDGDNNADGCGAVSLLGNIVCELNVAFENDDDREEKEKTDVTPENIKKIDDVISPDNKNCELNIVEDDSPSKHALAFTIDFGGGESSGSATAAVKYKNMVERFQSRHRRGQSLSKLETGQTMPVTPNTGRASRLTSAQNVKQSRRNTGGLSERSSGESEAAKVKIRLRERSTSGVRDASKRHSWSPRSSTHEAVDLHKAPEKTVNSPSVTKNSKTPQSRVKRTESPSNDISTTRVPKLVNKMKQLSSMERKVFDDDNTTYRSTAFTPRSTAMQLALNKFEFVCPEPPLDNFSLQKNIENDCESISEAGTYTVDGDNYTEEQKELMNIDKSSCTDFETHSSDCSKVNDTGQIRPTNLPLLSSSSENRRQNVLEISYYHDSTSLKPKISYLEKIKSRVKNITKSPEKKSVSPTDVGTFTSITTSGVLSKKSTLDSKPKLNRKNSLTKSQIDSSEYISAENPLKAVYTGPAYPNTFTDHQKAEYKLNVFNNQTNSQISNGIELNSNRSPVASTSPIAVDYDRSGISETGLKTAQTKNDWIQEWARNARRNTANNVTNNTDKSSSQMSRSYDFESSNTVFNDPNMVMIYHNKPIDRFRNHAIGEYEYSSDTNVASRINCISPNSSRSIDNNHKNVSGEFNNRNNNVAVFSRPPQSPSRIPSPMHTIGRARSVSRARGSLQDLSPSTIGGGYSQETDIYLQKTAAAISNYAQSLSRKNSLQSAKSPTSNSNSPRRLIQQHPHHHYSADECSPTHNIEQDRCNHHEQQHGLHKRNLSLDYRNNLMSQSLNNEALCGYSDYRNRQRQNSFDAIMGSPKRLPHQQLSKGNYIDQTCISTKQQQPSPIRRSSSFSVKPIGTGPSVGVQSTPGVHNRSIQKNIPPKAYLSSKAPIQKSASSTSFKKMYNDYDHNAEYYINDEDDLVDQYYSSDEEFDEPTEVCPDPEPITNTRYNKALLMRIERSKQKVAGNTHATNAMNKISGNIGGGVMACPNTPEMPRRVAQSNVRSSMRQSVPRDSSLNRLRGEVPNSLASAKKQLLQTASSTIVSKKVQPKYMDISKYKPSQGASFLRKDESKSTLVTRPEIRRSPSSASVTLSRSDNTRASNRSVKSAGGKPSGASGSGSSKRDISVPKQKETELAMWRRRATYDPMKAAAEGRKKQEEAKRLAQAQVKSNDSSVVLRSQSFHSGIIAVNRNTHRSERIISDGDESNYRWTLTSTESSDENEEFTVSKV